MNTSTIPQISDSYDGPAWNTLRHRIEELSRLERDHRATRRDLEHARGMGQRDATTQQNAARAAALVAGSEDVPTILRDHEARTADLLARSEALKLAREILGSKLEGASTDPSLAADVTSVMGAQHAKLVAMVSALAAAWADYDEARALAAWLKAPDRQTGLAATHLPALRRDSGKAYTVADALAALAAGLMPIPTDATRPIEADVA